MLRDQENTIKNWHSDVFYDFRLKIKECMIQDLLNENCEVTMRFGVCCSGNENGESRRKLPRE